MKEDYKIEEIDNIEEEILDDIREDYFIINDLLDFLDASVSMYHAVEESVVRLEEAGFKQLDLKQNWEIKNGGKYFIVINNSTVLAFVIGSNVKSGFRIIGAHTDSPGFKIKTNPIVKEEGYLKLNTEVYGGPLLETWLDRPLSIAGRVFLKGEKSHEPRIELFDFDYDFLTIPSLAIHMKRGDDSDKKLNPQIHTLPILGMGEDFDLDQFIADELDVNVDEILAHDLFLYNRERANIFGANAEFFQSGKIDNLGMVHSGLNALINSKEAKNTQVFVAFDNEEIGSSTQQGAASAMFRDVLRKISLTLGNSETEFLNQIYDSYMISADQAHALHPNYKEKNDITNKPKINEGPVIKDSARKSYATDGFGRAVLIDIAKKNDVPLQFYHNRSDVRGGSTIGAIIETNTGIRNIDIGNAMLAMHSAREMAGVKDQKFMLDLMLGFYESE